jgi:hypothetical protein
MKDFGWKGKIIFALVFWGLLIWAFFWVTSAENWPVMGW